MSQCGTGAEEVLRLRMRTQTRPAMMNHRDNNSNPYGFDSGGTHHGWMRWIDQRGKHACQYPAVDGQPVGHAQ